MPQKIYALTFSCCSAIILGNCGAFCTLGDLNG